MFKTLILDNYDSFTHILKQYVGEMGGNPEVHLNDRITVVQIQKMAPTHIILSPGPGNVEEPKDVGVMFKVIEAFWKKIPILGVCLGHQALAKFFGANIVKAPQVRHGKRSRIYHNGEGVFKGVSNPTTVMRYHSWVAESAFWLQNPKVQVAAHTEDFLVMGLQHLEYPVFGVQFHPESLGTKEGARVLRNFLKS